MAIGMCLVLVSESICVAVGGTRASIAAVFFVFAFEACFTWGTCPVLVFSEGQADHSKVGWPPFGSTPLEILPLKIRAKGAALAAAADFLGNFLVSFRLFSIPYC